MSVHQSDGSPLVADLPPLFRLPDELLECIVEHLPPTATVNFARTSRRSNKITYEPLVWRRHCVQTWRYWEPCHRLAERLELPPSQTKWRQLYNERTRVDRESMELFNQMLLTQQFRFERIEEIVKHGYDIKDLMLSLRDHTNDHTEDVLARRYYANAVLGQLHRITALEKWQRLQRQQMVRLEEVLGAYDLFVLNGSKGDLDDIDKELDRVANCIRDQNPGWDSLSIRTKATRIGTYLRSQNLVGNPNVGDFHALRNNFISMALFDDVHTSLPLQSVAIYCAVARRLGVNAKPSNYPQHVHAVIEAPQDCTLDGKPKTPTYDADPELMYMDPWRTDEEIPPQTLRMRLLQMGAPNHQHIYHLGATSSLEMALRTGRNIMTSVQEARERQRGNLTTASGPDIEAAWYSMLWSMLVLGDSNSATTLHRRRQCLPYLVEHYQSHFPEDLNLIEKYIPPLFESEREHAVLSHLITTARAADRSEKVPNYRGLGEDRVHYLIGSLFRHRRYGYEGVIVGWDKHCGAEPRWIEQMRVDDLSRGRHQPFYNVVADDKSVRYVAEENIEVVGGVNGKGPSAALLQLAGRYFKRWDEEQGLFISNIRDEYPDD